MTFDDLCATVAALRSLPLTPTVVRIYVHNMSTIYDLGLPTLKTDAGLVGLGPAIIGVPIAVSVYVEPGCAEVELSDGSFKHFRLFKPCG